MGYTKNYKHEFMMLYLELENDRYQNSSFYIDSSAEDIQSLEIMLARIFSLKKQSKQTK